MSSKLIRFLPTFDQKQNEQRVKDDDDSIHEGERSNRQEGFGKGVRNGQEL